MHDPAAFLIAGVMLDFLGGDGPCALRHVAEFQLPDRQHPQPVIAQHADIEFAPLDILLRDGGRADTLVDESDPLLSFSSLSTTEAWRSQRRILANALDDQRQAKTCRPANLAVLGETANAGTGMRW